MASKAARKNRTEADLHRSEVQALALKYGVSEKLIRFCFNHHWRCYLCGLSIPREFQYPMAPWAPTRDHIVPRHHRAFRLAVPGGLNLALAHRFCNCLKGDESYGSFDRAWCRERILERAERWPVEIA